MHRVVEIRRARISGRMSNHERVVGTDWVVALQGQLSGIVGPLGWLTVALYLLFTLGYGYFQFARKP